MIVLHNIFRDTRYPINSTSDEKKLYLHICWSFQWPQSKVIAFAQRSPPKSATFLSYTIELGKLVREIHRRARYRTPQPKLMVNHLFDKGLRSF